MDKHTLQKEYIPINEKLTGLQSKMEDLLTQARSYLDDEEMPESDRTERYDKVLEDLKKVEKDYEREIELSKINSRHSDLSEQIDDAAAAKRPHLVEESVEPTVTEEDIDYQRAFDAYAMRGLEGMTEAEKDSLSRRGTDPLQAGTDALGGHIVPDEPNAALTATLKAYGPMNTVGRLVTTPTGASMSFPVINDVANVAAIKGEGAAFVVDDTAFSEVSLGAYKFTTRIDLTREFLMDNQMGQGILGELQHHAGIRLARALNSGLTTGSGSGQPQGVITGSTRALTTAANNALKTDEIISCLHKLDPAYRAGSNVAWMFNDSVLEYVRKLKDSNGLYIWQMGDIRAGIPSALLGHRYYVNMAMDGVAATKKPVLFGNFDYFLRREVGGVYFLRSDHALAANDKILLAWSKRVDSKVLIGTAFYHVLMKT